MVLLLAQFALAETMYVVDATNDRIMRYDTIMATSTLDRALGFNILTGQMAYDDILQRAYLLTSSPTQSLYTYDLRAGTLTYTAALAPLVSAADVDPRTGDIYAVDRGNNTFVRIDPTTGASTVITPLAGPYHGGYWDDARDALIVNLPNVDTFYALSRTGAATYIGGLGTTFMFEHDLDVDAYGIAWSFDAIGVRRAFDTSNFNLLLEASGQIWAAGALTSDNGPTPGSRIVATSPVSCPGPISLRITGLTPRGGAAIVQGNGPGSFTIPSGFCAGTVLPLANPRLVTTFTVSSGPVLATPTFSAAMCGKSFMAVDLNTCRLSNVFIP